MGNLQQFSGALIYDVWLDERWTLFCFWGKGSVGKMVTRTHQNSLLKNRLLYSPAPLCTTWVYVEYIAV